MIEIPDFGRGEIGLIEIPDFGRGDIGLIEIPDFCEELSAVYEMAMFVETTKTKVIKIDRNRLKLRFCNIDFDMGVTP